MLQQDVIVRMIQQLGEAVARIMGLPRTTPLADVLQAIEDAKGALPLVPGMVDHTGASALSKMLGREQCALLGQLLLKEAEVLEQMNRGAKASLRRKRGNELRLLCESGRGGVAFR